MGEILSLAIVAAGGILSLRTRFVQRRLGAAFGAMLSRETGGGGLSAFGALCTTLAATLGTGNIVGVAGAVALGGSGALLWMVLSAFFSMALKYCECSLGAKTRRHTRDGLAGGPFVYIEERLGKWPARLFALCGALAGALSIGTTLQMDSVIGVLDPARGKNSLVICAVTAVLAGWVLRGGARAIAAFCEKVIPVMSAAYVLCTLVILWNFRFALPMAIRNIFVGAFCPSAVLGGTVGGLIRSACVGISRGVFSNEAGLGSGAIAAATAEGDPHRMGLVGMVGVFVDTVVMCTLTGLCVTVTGAHNGAVGSGIAAAVFRTGLGEWSVGLLGAFLCIFAFTTIVGWYFFAGACFRYLTADRFETAFRLFYVGMLLLTPLVQSDRLWMLADILNTGMALPNLAALLLRDQSKRIFCRKLY